MLSRCEWRERGVGGKGGSAGDRYRGGWRFVVPRAGLRALVVSEGIDASFDSGAWVYGELRANALIVGGDQVVGPRGGAVADPGGGTTIDTQARTTLAIILSSMRTHGLIAS